MSYDALMHAAVSPDISALNNSPPYRLRTQSMEHLKSAKWTIKALRGLFVER